MNPRTRVRAALLLVSGIVVLAACSSHGNGDSSPSSANNSGGSAAQHSGQDFAATPLPASANSGTASLGDDTRAPAKEAAATPDPEIQRSVISTGTLSITSSHPDATRSDALAVTTGLGGTVDDEQSTSDSRGRLDRVDLTLRIPAAKFETALDRLSKLGTLRAREQSSKDVTTQVIDIGAKVRAQRASVRSFQQLLARASTIAEIMSVESQLTDRQATLDSLVQQQKYLADQTSMSTIQLTLTRRTHPPKKHVDHAGFIGGLQDGWHALGASTLAVGAALGALLPFAVLLGLIVVAGRLSVRKIRARDRSAA